VRRGEGGRGRRKSQKVRGKMDIDMEWNMKTKREKR
jgi:hypothetical protein